MSGGMGRSSAPADGPDGEPDGDVDDGTIFVDQIQDGYAEVMKKGGDAVKVPLDMLPKGIREGQSFDLKSGQIIEGPEMGDPPGRARMSADDDGGPIKL